MKTTNIILIVFIFFSTFLKAQTDYRPGYVIDKIGDTIYGSIDYRGDILMSKICKFKSDDDTITEFLPGEITAYRFTDSKYFVSRSIEGKNVFLEYLIKGEVNVYFIKSREGEHYFIDKENAPLIEIPYEEGIKYVKNTPRIYKSTRHYGVLSSYLNDAPETFKSRIKRIKKPSRYNLINIAEDYHNAVCDDEACIVYEKKAPFFKMSIEPTFGHVRYRVSKETGLEYGVYMYLWSPRTNEKLYFKTGIIQQRISYNQTEEIIYKIPLQIEYLYPSKVFKPKVSIGYNLYSAKNEYDEGVNAHSFAFNTGFNYKLGNSTYLSVNINSDITPFADMLYGGDNFGLISFSYGAGLYIEL